MHRCGEMRGRRGALLAAPDLAKVAELDDAPLQRSEATAIFEQRVKRLLLRIDERASLFPGRVLRDGRHPFALPVLPEVLV